MKTYEHFISCDWGTSSFRLYLVRIADGNIVHNRTDGMGIKALQEQWQATSDVSRLDFFLQYLEEQIRLFPQDSQPDLHRLPVLISGMASSSIGMMELAYADLPFSLSGRDLVIRSVSPPGHSRAVWLLSGLKSYNDVMRGEESQMIGLADQFGQNPAVAILPGTHSKHIHIEKGTITDFHTFMTGEFYAILSEHSILRHSLHAAASDQDIPWFEKGVRSARQHHILNAAFHVRTNELLHELTTAQNRSYLSGLLIGSELTALPEDLPVYLCGGGQLQPLYLRALNVLEREQVSALSSEVVERAVVQAHLKQWRKIDGR